MRFTPEATARHARARRRPRTRAFVAAGALCLILGTPGLVTLLEGATNPVASSAPLDMRGHPVALDSAAITTVAVETEMKAVPTTGNRFAVPSVRLDVPLGALNAVDHTITPPGFTSAYAVRNLGTTLEAPGAGTVYVVAHSIRGGGIAPGNYLQDTDTETSRVKPGAVVHVGNLDYHVTSSEKITKTQLADDQAIWSDIPNRLVVITCLEHADGSPSTDNLILTATRND